MKQKVGFMTELSQPSSTLDEIPFDLNKCAVCGRSYPYNKKNTRGHQKTMCAKCYKRQRKIQALSKIAPLECLWCHYNKYKKNLNQYYSKKLNKSIILCKNCATEAKDLGRITKTRPELDGEIPF